jgi:hypothetical protein
MSMRKFRWALVLMPASTLVILLVLIRYPAAIAAVVPGPLGKVVVPLVGIVLLATDIWAVIFLSRQYQREWRDQVESRTGRSVEEWIELVSAQGPRERSERKAWMRAQYGLSEAEAEYILVEKDRRAQIAAGGVGVDKRLVLLGCSVAMLLLIIGAVWGMMILAKGIQ